MASLIGETVTLTVTFSTFADTFFTKDVFSATFVVGAGMEVSGQAISATFTSGGFSHTMSGTISFNVDNDDFTLSFNGTQQPGSLTYKLTSVADQSAAQVTSATQTGSSGFTGGVNQAASPTFGGANGGFVTGGINMLGFQPGVGVSQSVGFTFLDASNPPTLAVNTGSTVVEGGLDTLTVAELDTNDGDTADASLVYKVTKAAANGTLFLDADGDNIIDAGEERGLNATFTQADIGSGKVKYLHNGGETTADTFEFSVTDGVTTLAGKNFNFAVTPVNDAPAIANLNADVRNWSEAAGVNVGLDQGLNAAIADVDDSNFNGGSLILSFSGGGLAEDQLILANLGFVTVSGGSVFFNGDAVGTVTGGVNGANLVISFNTNDATAQAVTGVLQAIQYANTGGDNPTQGNRIVNVVVNDGSANSATAAVTVNVAGQDDPAVAADDAVSTVENGTLLGQNLFSDNGSGPDVDPDSPLVITAVNGVAASVGTTIALASGATLQVAADGSYTYNPNGKFNHLPGEGSGATNLTATDSFTYTLAGGDTATVTVTIHGVDSDGDNLIGSAGADKLDGGIGADKMTGLGGNDLYYVNNAGDAVVESKGQGTADHVAARTSYALAAGVDIELLSTTSAAGTTAINLTGNALKQTITGNAGTNTLRDGSGAGDVLKGLGGNDTYLVYSADTVIVEGSTEGAADKVAAAVDFVLGAGVAVEIITTTANGGTSDLNLTGNALKQEITGNAGDNILHDGGSGAADTLRGLGGSDTYRVFNSGDVIVETAAQGTADKVVAAVDYVLGDDVHVEILQTNGSAGTAAIDLTGNALKQEIIGNAGDNILHDGGQGAADTLRGMGGNDTYRIFNSGDVIVEASSQGAADKVIAAVDYALGAGVHVEFMQTNASAGTSAIDLTGNEIGQDIRGNAGVNIIDGKGGNDTLRGGSGGDFFVFSTALGAGNVDTIADYSAAADTIRLENAIFAALTATGTLAAAAFRANTTGLAGDASDRIIYETDTGRLFYDADGTGATAGIHFATLTGAPSLTNADFVVI